MHCTHSEVVPRSLHLGVPPPHAVQLAPQLVSALHSEHTPEPEHAWLVSQSLSVSA